MPELPEVEVVREGLHRWVVGRTIEGVKVYDPRSLRRYAPGPVDLASRLRGARMSAAVRRGKFLWFPLDWGDSDSRHRESDDSDPQYALLAHLGMSGQLVLSSAEHSPHRHLRVRLELSERAETPAELHFIDQRLFGGLSIVQLYPTADGRAAGQGSESILIPHEAAHIARDPLDPHFSVPRLFEQLRTKTSGIKRVLLDQNVISGIGNIYADEALWRAKLHYAQPANTLSKSRTTALVESVRQVMRESLAQGGTSFDSLYVNVNGSSGYFSRSLNVYGREGEPCYRCLDAGRTSLIVREPFMNRSSFRCPWCQRVRKARA